MQQLPVQQLFVFMNAFLWAIAAAQCSNVSMCTCLLFRVYQDSSRESSGVASLGSHAEAPCWLLAMPHHQEGHTVVGCAFCHSICPQSSIIVIFPLFLFILELHSFKALSRKRHYPGLMERRIITQLLHFSFKIMLSIPRVGCSIFLQMR